eukprot:UN04225
MFLLSFIYPLYNTVKRFIRSKQFWESSFYHNLGDYVFGLWLSTSVSILSGLQRKDSWRPIILHGTIPVFEVP